MTADTEATGSGAAPAELGFRTGTAADVPCLVALVESAYRGEQSRAGWTTEADLLDGQRTDTEEMRSALADPDSLLLAAERGGVLVACCRLQRHTGPAGERAARFGLFAVRPVLQGTGLGGSTLREAERTARTRWDAREMRMDVLTVRTDLIAWYRRRGYVPTGRRSPFPYGDPRFGVPRRPDLEFEQLVKPLP